MGVDSDAWETLLKEHGPYAQALARSRMRRAGYGPAEADEVLQDAWTLLLQEGRLSRIDPARGLRPYLSACVLNAARMWLRSNGKRKAREAIYAAPGRHPEAPEEALLLRESSERLDAALASLPSRERLVLRWIYWDGLPYDRIGDLLGISEEGVGPLLTQARGRLRAFLGK